ncbi:MAG: hypothetical protein V3T23_00920, partial [Nitrososphaerales archaeon]
MREWQEGYGPHGFTIIGVHTPEYWWEKPDSHVQNAIVEFKINYPIVNDSSYTIWNRWRPLGLWTWPTSYLVDKNGTIRLRHYGPVNKKLEAVIETLLS